MNSSTSLKCSDPTHGLDIVAICVRLSCLQTIRLCCSKCLIRQHVKCSTENNILFLEDLKNENYSEILKISPLDKIIDIETFVPVKNSSQDQCEEVSKLETSLNDKIQRITNKIETALYTKKNEVIDSLNHSAKKSQSVFDNILLLREIFCELNQDQVKINETCQSILKSLLSQDNVSTGKIDIATKGKQIEQKFSQIEERLYNLIKEVLNFSISISTPPVFTKTYCSRNIEFTEMPLRIKKTKNSNSTNDAIISEVLKGEISFSVQCSGINKPNGDWIQLGIIPDDKKHLFEAFSGEYPSHKNLSISSGNYFNGKNHFYGMKHEKGNAIDFNKEILNFEFSESRMEFIVYNDKMRYSGTMKEDVKYRFFVMLFEVGNEVEFRI